MRSAFSHLKGTCQRSRDHMASRGSSQKDQWQWSEHFQIEIIISLTLHHLQKFDFRRHFYSACLHFTPSQGFWVLLSCHCHRQDSFRYLTKSTEIIGLPKPEFFQYAFGQSSATLRSGPSTILAESVPSNQLPEQASIADVREPRHPSH